jgi:hypothetical protein
MASVGSFYFYEDPIARTGGTLCTLSQDGQLWSISPTPANAPKDLAAKVATAIRDLKGQDLADGVGELTKTIYREDGSLFGTIVATIASGSGGSVPTVTAIAVLGISYSPAKAEDLAEGLELFVDTI